MTSAEMDGDGRKIKRNELVFMKSSVLMSVYREDNPQHLMLALNSIYNDQTVKPDEIIVVFDGELTDELNAVLNEFQDGKENFVHYYPQAENKGLGEALRIGSEHCHGELIFRMDADDISVPTRFEQQLTYMETHPEIDVLGGIIQEFKFSTDDVMRARVCPQNHDDIVKMCKYRNPMNHVTVCIRKKALVKTGGYLPLPLMEDYYLWVRMIGDGYRLANIPDVVVYVRIGNGFISRRSEKKQIKSRWLIQKCMMRNHIIHPFGAVANIVSFAAFVYCPIALQRLVYEKFLRKD